MSTFPPIPKIEKSTVVYQGYYKIQIDELSLPDTHVKPYNVLLVAQHASIILAETDDGHLVINKEYRHPTGLWLYALPGGRVDGDEEPLRTAQRELLEETGFKSSTWHHLGTAFPLPAVCGQKIHYYSAQSAHPCTTPTREPMELIETVLMKEADLLEEIRKGAPTDGILLTALSFRRMFKESQHIPSSSHLS